MLGRHALYCLYLDDLNLMMCLCIDMQTDHGNHQEQVQELTKETADSLDNLALKMLFVSVQQNNLELCIKCAIQ
jgi:hypothetical protein